MAIFINDLKVTRVSRRAHTYVLAAPFMVRRGNGPTSDIVDFVTVPKGFPTDGASVPGWLWGFIPPDGATFKAAVIHDYLGWRMREGNDPHPGFATQLQIDQFFLEMMTDLKVPTIQRTAMYLAVRAVAKLNHYR